jgi:hypothetical protein
MNVHVFLLVFFLICSLALLCSLCWPYYGPVQPRAAAKVRTVLPRLRHRPATQTIAPPVVSPPLPRRVEGPRLCLCDLGQR